MHPKGFIMVSICGYGPVSDALRRIKLRVSGMQMAPTLERFHLAPEALAEGPRASSPTDFSVSTRESAPHVARRRTAQRLRSLQEGLGEGRHQFARDARAYTSTLSANARSKAAPSPCHALPCMQASVVGCSPARRSSIVLACFVCEK